MRSEENWEKYAKPAYVRDKFPPRIQRDLAVIEQPANLPPIGDGLFIEGPTETGKTLLSVFFILEEQKQIYLEGGPKDELDVCVFMSTAQLLKEIQDAIGQSASDPSRGTQLIQYYSGVRLLVLDDFGTTKSTDWVINTLYLIVNARYEWLKKTIVNANLPLPELAKVMGDDRITSRIDRMCRKVRKTKNWLQ